MLAVEGMSGKGDMISGAKKVTQEEIEEFLKEINGIKAPKITRGELKNYLEAFPKEYSCKEIQFLMNGQNQMDSITLYQRLKSTQIEDRILMLLREHLNFFMFMVMVLDIQKIETFK